MKASFLKAVEERDLTSVRFFLSNELLLDPRGISFLEMKSWAEKNCSGLYEAPDKIDYQVIEKDWNENFLYMIKNDLDNSFTKERLALYEKVSKVVLKEKAHYLDNEENKSGDEKELVLPRKANEEKPSLKPIIGLLIVGFFVVLLGVLIKVKVLCIVGCLVCAIDIIVLLIKSSKR